MSSSGAYVALQLGRTANTGAAVWRLANSGSVLEKADPGAVPAEFREKTPPRAALVAAAQGDADSAAEAASGAQKRTAAGNKGAGAKA